MVFSAVIWQRAIHGIARLDRALGEPGRRIVDVLGRLFFGGWHDRHMMRFDLPEEDEGIYIYTHASGPVYLLFPYFSELPPIGFVDSLPSSEADSIVGFFDQSVRRLLFANGRGRTVLTKSTCSLGRIQTLRRAYPDARFIHLVRHPAEAIPSHVKIFFPVWQQHSPEIQKILPETRAYAELAAKWYRHMLDAAPSIAAVINIPSPNLAWMVHGSMMSLAKCFGPTDFGRVSHSFHVEIAALCALVCRSCRVRFAGHLSRLA